MYLCLLYNLNCKLQLHHTWIVNCNYITPYLELVDNGCSFNGCIEDSPTVCSTIGDGGGLATVFDSTRSSAVLYVLTSSDNEGKSRDGTPYNRIIKNSTLLVLLLPLYN